MSKLSCFFVFILFSLFASSCLYQLPPQGMDFRESPSLDEGREIAQRAAQRSRMDPPADRTTSVTLSRDGAILTALSRNRTLAVQRFGPQIASTRAPEALAQFDPLLTAVTSVGRSKIPINDADDRLLFRDMGVDAKISQRLASGTDVFLSGGVSRDRSGTTDWEYSGAFAVGINQALLRGSNSEINLISVTQAQNAEKISSYELQGFIQNLILRMELAYWELVLAKEKVKIREFSVKLAEEQLQLNKDFILVGKLSPDARVSAEAELASRKADLVDALAEVKSRMIALISLMDPVHEDQWSIVFDPADPPEVEIIEVDSDVSARLSFLYRPELFQAHLNRSNKRLEIVKTRNGLLPRLDAFASYGRLSAGDSWKDSYRYLDNNDFDNYEVGLMFEMYPANRAEKARYERAQLEEEQARAAIANLEKLVEFDVRQSAIEAQRQAQRISATQKVVESREEELRIEKSRFRVGLSTNLDVLRVERDLVQARLDELTARVRYIESLSNLYYAEGTLHLRRGVNVEKR